jgi:hypothetical protein
MDLQRPIWIGPHRVVTVRWRHDQEGNRPVGLVIVDVATGDAEPIIEGRVGDVSVSRTLGLIAFRLGPAKGRIALYDIDTGNISFVPRRTAEIVRVELDGAHEDAV